jgi:hypothetical protein
MPSAESGTTRDSTCEELTSHNFIINSNILNLKLLEMYVTMQCWEKNNRLYTDFSICFYDVFEI